MKILFISNLFPPYFIGGYEQLCKDVADGLSARGHDCHILTSTYGVGKRAIEGHVYRILELEGDFQGRRHSWHRLDRIRMSNEAIVAEMVKDIAPDIIFVWSLRRFSRSLLLLVEKIHTKVAYYVTDNWLLDQYRPTWQNLRKFVQSYRYIFGRPKLRHVICSSEHMKLEMMANRVPLGQANVIYNGVDLEPFLKIQRDYAQGNFRILSAGRLVPQKGVHTLLQSFIRLVEKTGPAKFHLTIVGDGEAGYVRELKAMARDAGLEGAVSFTGNVSREELAGYFAAHDIFVFPSIWQEPFSLTLIMALASEIAVVGTLSGGSKEILKDRYNCLVFEPGDVSDLAGKLELLSDDAGLRKSLARQGRADSQAYTLQEMIDRVEKVLKETASGH